MSDNIARNMYVTQGTIQPWQQPTTTHGNKTRSCKYHLDAAADER
jgi:hypothetical protein